VWHYFERTEEEVDNALAKMQKQYASHEFTIDGEILHVFGLWLLLSDRGAIKNYRPEILEEGKKYIDELYQAKKLHVDIPATFSEMRFDGYGGLGIHENKTAEYKELFTYLRVAKQKALEDTYPEKALDLLDELKGDTQQFYRRLCYSAAPGSGEYAGVPVLAKLDPDMFLDTVLSLHPADQHVVMMALKARFEHGRLERDLPDEKPWLEKVRDNLLARAKRMTPMSRFRVESHVNWYLKPILQTTGTADTEDNAK